MPFIIGTDEAGYGPNLGPLVVGASMWHVPDVSDLYRELRTVIRPPGKVSNADRQIPIGDSKALYQSKGNIAGLERSVLTMLGVVDRMPSNLFELFNHVARQSSINLASETTYCWSDIEVPVSCERAQVDSLAKRVRETLTKKNIQFCGLRASVVFPEQFNKGLASYGNKASLLSTVTCRLVREMIDSIELMDELRDDDHVTILCDKHGGRSHYAGLLQQEMTDSFVRVVSEGRPESGYQWLEKSLASQRQFDMRFLMKGERFMPIALGSMIAKYLRELSMNAWNLFWCQQMPDLQPTAGYPQDAKRFKKEIAKAQSKLKVKDEIIWREK